jgi:hypothetical protein
VLLVGIAGPNDAAASTFDGSQVFPEVARRVEALPGVASATLSWTVPLSGWSRSTQVGKPESSDEGSSSYLAIVGERYFETLSIPLLQGRGFSELEGADHPGVVVVNEALAQRFWPGEDPLGRRVLLPQIAGVDESSAFEVIGLAGIRGQATLWEEPEPLVYLSLRQEPKRRVSLVIRTRSQPSSIIGPLRTTLRESQPEMAIVDMLTFATHIRGALLTQHMNARILAILAGLGLILATIGVWSSMNAMVRQRHHEIGIRLTLGAEPRAASRLVILHALRLAIPGILLGLVATLGFLRLLSGLVEGAEISPEPGVFLLSGFGLLLITYGACLLPARRASRVDPLSAIRS